MSISIISTNKSADIFVDAIHAVDSSIDIQVWPNEKDKNKIEFALCWRYPEGLLLEYPKLGCISSMGAGIDQFLSDKMLPKDIPMVRIVDKSLAESMYEYTCAVVMDILRNFRQFYIQQQDSNWLQQYPMAIKETSIGIMGLGELGGYAAKKFSAMGFCVSGWSRSKKLIEGVSCFSGEQALKSFVEDVDILICLLPLTKETNGILNITLFHAMKKDSSIINVARGEHLNESDLLEVLQTGHIKSACLDVFREEPLPKAHPFWQHEKIMVTPHCSSITDPTSVAPQIVENYWRMKRGQDLLNQVNIKKGY